MQHNARQSPPQLTLLLDLSNCGRIFVTGPHAGAFLRQALTWPVHALPTHRSHAALLCDNNGGILALLRVFRLADSRFLAIATPASAAATRLRALSTPPGVEISDRSDATASLALAGPGAPALLSTVLGPDAPAMAPPGHCIEFEMAGFRTFMAHEPLFGQDSYHFLAARSLAGPLREKLLAAGASATSPQDLDALRIESGLPIPGVDLDPAVTPWEAGLEHLVSFDDSVPFAGCEALALAATKPPERRLSRITAADDSAIRVGCAILFQGVPIASVTSAARSFGSGTHAGLAIIPAAALAGRLEMEIGGQRTLVTATPANACKCNKTDERNRHGSTG